MKETGETNNKISLKARLLSFLPALFLMVIIYQFSAKTATQSTATSSPIAETLLRLYERLFGQVNPDTKLKLIDLFSLLVRKTAHVCEYALLSLLYCFHFYCIKFRGMKLWLWGAAAGTLYAATDEFHQLFVEGRSGELKDVFIDAAGAMAGAFLFLVIIYLLKKRIK